MKTTTLSRRIPTLPRPCGQRKGFTLTELVVVVTILGILASLMLSGLLGARERQRAVKASTTIRKLSEVILPYYESYEVRRPDLPSNASITQLPTACFKELRRIATRRLMTLELPDRAIDVVPARHSIVPDIGDLKMRADLQPLNLLAKSAGVMLSEMPPSVRRYDRIIANAKTAWAAAGKNPADFSVESDELLHMIVTRGPVADPDVVAHFRPDEVGDADGDGLPEFLDGWGRPISFLRWPVGFASPVQPIDGTLLGIDTDVSEKGHRLVPLIFSAGSDGAFDIGENVPAPPERVPKPYAASNFDPFFYDAGKTVNVDGMNCFDPEPLKNAVNLTTVSIGPAGKATTVFRAERNTTGATPPNGSFQAIGSERDQNRNGTIESLDNVHNHDLTR